MKHHFQDTWVAKLPWVEYVVGVDGKVHQVKCKVCSKIEECDKLLVLKLDSLWKHVGHKKVVTLIANVAVKEYNFLKMNQHVFNECLYVSMGRYFEPCSCRYCDRKK
jgi:transposase